MARKGKKKVRQRITFITFFLILFSISILAFRILPATTPITQRFELTTPTSIYYRPFNLAYADQGGKQLPEPDAQIISAFQQFPDKPTMITNVLLNYATPSNFDGFLRQLQQITPHLCFAMGKSTRTLPTDYQTMISMAQAYRAYTDCIRLDQFNSLVANSGEQPVISFLNDLHNMGFNYIESNPWTQKSSGYWPWLTAAEINVDTSTWQAHTDRIGSVLAGSPAGFIVLSNYENGANSNVAQRLLTGLGAQGSIDALSVAANAQNGSPTPYQWFPPWTLNYDSYALGTLSWIGNELATIDPASSSSSPSLSTTSFSDSSPTFYSSSSSASTTAGTSAGTSTTVPLSSSSAISSTITSTSVFSSISTILSTFTSSSTETTALTSNNQVFYYTQTHVNQFTFRSLTTTAQTSVFTKVVPRPSVLQNVGVQLSNLSKNFLVQIIVSLLLAGTIAVATMQIIKTGRKR